MSSTDDYLDGKQTQQSADKTHQHEIVKGGVSAFSTRLVGMAFSYVFTFLISRMYGAAGNGLYNLTQSLMTFTASITKLGSDTLMTRYGAQYNAQKKFGWIKDLYNKSLMVSVPLAILFSLALYFLAPFIAVKVFQKQDEDLIRAFRIATLALLPVTIFNISNGGLRGLKKIRVYTMLQNVSNFFFGCIIISVLYFVTDDKVVPVITYVAFVTIGGILSGYFFLKYSNYSSTPVEQGLEFNEKFLIGISLFVASLASLIRGYADTFILGRYASIEDVGIYRNAFKVATITRIALTAFLVPAAPKFAELFSQGKMKELGESAQFATKIIFWCSAPILAGVILLAPFIMGIFGKEFLAGTEALIILSIGQFINAATGPVSNILMMTGRQKLNRNLMVATTVLAIVLDLLIIPRYGIIGAACVNTLGIIIMNLIPFFLIKYFYGFYTLDFTDLFKVNPKTFVKQIRQALKPAKKKKGEQAEKEGSIEDQIGGME